MGKIRASALLLLLALLQAASCLGQDDVWYTSLPEAIKHKDSVYRLVLSGAGLTSMPALEQFPHLEKLYADSNDITTLEGVYFPEHLQELILTHNRISRVTANVHFPKGLAQLTMTANGMVQFEPGGMDSLRFLELDDNRLTSLPASIGSSQNLFSLRVNGNKLTTLPQEIGKCRNLGELYIEHNSITQLPASMGMLKMLSRLYAGHNKLTQLPDLSELTELEIIGVDNNVLKKVSFSFAKLQKLKDLDLGNNKMSTISSDVFQAEEEVDLFNNLLHPITNIRFNADFKGKVAIWGNPLTNTDQQHLQRMLPHAQLVFKADDYGEMVPEQR